MKSAVTSKAVVGKSRDIFTIQEVNILIEAPAMGSVPSSGDIIPYKGRRVAFNLEEGIQGDRKDARDFSPVMRRLM